MDKRSKGNRFYKNKGSKKLMNNDMRKYWLVCWLACLFMLAAISYQNIQYENRIDEIFEEYNKKMNEIL